jgi:glyoxylase-like metal-dependent hydrolase (beta-lactamase superfamily II)
MGRLVEVAPGVVQVPVLGAQVWLLLDAPLTLVDTGTRGSGGAILRALARLGRRPEELASVVLTHYHPDHAGALPELLAACAGDGERGAGRLPRVAIHAAEAPYLEAPGLLPNPFQSRLPRTLVEPVWPLVRLRRACAVDVALRDGDPLPGRSDARVIHLPGHTPGSVAVYLPEPGLVLGGDAFERRRGELGPPSRRFTEDWASAWASIRRLGTFEFDTLCFSHFPPLWRGAGAAVRALGAGG